MNILVNGKDVMLPANISIQGWLEASNIDTSLIAVEHNGNLLEKTSFSIILQDGDKLEIVRFVGGG